MREKLKFIYRESNSSNYMVISIVNKLINAKNID